MITNSVLQMEGEMRSSSEVSASCMSKLDALIKKPWGEVT